MPVRLGIITPVLTLLPGAHARWEDEGTIDDVARIARAAEDLGYDHLTCSEHVAVPVEVAKVRGARYWDPLATFGYLAARTTTLRLATNVLVLGYHHPLEIAKRYGTLDAVSGGRLILGVGVGSLQEEFDLLGVPFDDRGERADESLRALRASLSQPIPSFAGAHTSYEGMVVEPCAVQEHVPIWIGGRTGRSLRRAVELGDGWTPFGLGAADLRALLDRARATDAWARRPTPLELVFQPGRAYDPIGDPDGTRAAAAALVAIGATTLSVRLVHHSLDHYLEQLEAMAALAATLTGGPTA
ncbi:LLM class F420-dependent oxidoreductase [Aquihabitans sp. McL0605]|uniref:LLM class F420-dependent oxidoreductase n=1 Tax=Aquihabitans sp. McL0605 TaxID=3415671 RepID=UPI003CF294F3